VSMTSFRVLRQKKNWYIFCVGTLHGHLVRKIKNASFSFVVIFVCTLLPSVPFFPALAWPTTTTMTVNAVATARIATTARIEGK
jgi:hypothetical protein